jgi:hypothetical protein
VNPRETQQNKENRERSKVSGTSNMSLRDYRHPTRLDEGDFAGLDLVAGLLARVTFVGGPLGDVGSRRDGDEFANETARVPLVVAVTTMRAM